MDLFQNEKKPVDPKHAAMWAMRRKKSLLKFRAAHTDSKIIEKKDKD